MSAVSRKRRGDEASASRPKNDRFQKKRKRAQQTAYHSDSDSIEGGSDEEGDDLKAPETLGLEGDNEDGSDDGFQAVDLLDSDDENLDALADDGASSDEDQNDEMDLEGIESGDDDDDEDNNNDKDSLDSLSDNGDNGGSGKKQKQTKTKPAQRVAAARDAPTDSEGDDDDDDDDDAYNSGDDSDNGAGARAPKSKRNDPATFATSLSKILGTKLSTTRRADPVLARSADAREASRRVVDASLEEKARRQMRLEKRAALERGRVKDVLIATAKPQAEGITAGDAAGEVNVGETTTTIMATERRLRKVAQRGVVQLFNAVRAAQVKAAQAKKQAKAEGMIGMDKREAKVTEMSRKGFLDLIASGGGGLKKGGLEEA